MCPKPRVQIGLQQFPVVLSPLRRDTTKKIPRWYLFVIFPWAVIGGFLMSCFRDGNVLASNFCSAAEWILINCLFCLYFAVPSEPRLTLSVLLPPLCSDFHSTLFDLKTKDGAVNQPSDSHKLQSLTSLICRMWLHSRGSHGQSFASSGSVFSEVKKEAAFLKWKHNVVSSRHHGFLPIKSTFNEVHVDF